MDRRQFCRSAVAAGVAAAFLPACGKKTPVATQADTGIAAISLDGAEIELAKEFGCARATVNRALRELAEAGDIGGTR